MTSQKVTNYCDTQNYLVIAEYISTPHSSKFAYLVFEDFCLAILPIEDFFRNHQLLSVRE